MTLMSSLLRLRRRSAEGDVAAQIELGLLCEQCGRLEEGMNWLSLAARHGDPTALTLVGVRLISGPYAPRIAARGPELLAEAMGRGSGEAALRLACLHATGVYMSKDWSLALDLLERAAELGCFEARIELSVLADGPGAIRKPAAGAASRLRDRIDIDSWTRARETVTLNAAPRIVAVEAFVPRRARDWIVEQARPGLARAEVYDPVTGQTSLSAERTNRAANFGLANTNLVILALQEALSATVGADLARAEGASVLCYAPGERAGEHFDFLDPAVPAYQREIASQGQRVATGLVYLNDDFGGGATDFPALGLSHTPRAGGALLFSNVTPAGDPDLRSLHAGRPPRDASKWVLSCFVRSRVRLPVSPP